jgi:5-formyltetrahydrofolate cyclo-ligase
MPQAAYALAAHASEHPVFKTSQAIACYYSHDDEMNTFPLIAKIWEQGKTCYLPVMTEEKCIKFVRFEANDALEKNQYGIFEPVNHSRSLKPSELQLIFMPLVAFDLQGNRLGMGAGYYDRSLAFLFSENQNSVRPHLAGIAYAKQQAGPLPTDPWDVPLDSVITENGFRFFS